MVYRVGPQVRNPRDKKRASIRRAAPELLFKKERVSLELSRGSFCPRAGAAGLPAPQPSRQPHAGHQWRQPLVLAAKDTQHVAPARSQLADPHCFVLAVNTLGFSSGAASGREPLLCNSCVSRATCSFGSRPETTSSCNGCKRAFGCLELGGQRGGALHSSAGKW